MFGFDEQKLICLPEADDEGILTNLPKLAQEAYLYYNSDGIFYKEALKLLNERIEEESGYFSCGISDEELQKIEKPTSIHCFNYLYENDIDLDEYEEYCREEIKNYAMVVLTEILKRDKQQP